MKKILYTLIAIIGFANVSLSQTQINNITNFSDFNKSTTSSQVSNITTPNVGFNFSSSATTADSGIMNKTFNTNTNNCTKVTINFVMNLTNGKGLDVIVNGGNNSTTAWTDTYRTAGNYPAPNTDWEYNRDFYTNIVEMKLKFSTNVNSAGNSIVKNLMVTGYPTGCAILCLDSITTQPTNKTVNINSNASFIVATNDSLATYQWQTDLGMGFQNISSAGQFNGATNDTLIVSNASINNNNQNFRCIVSSGSCKDTSSTVKLTVNNNTGINSPSNVNAIKVYPNPASTILHIDLEKPGYYTAKLSSVAGQSIVSPTTGTIDISALANGVYILTIYDSNNKLNSTNKVAIVK